MSKIRNVVYKPKVFETGMDIIPFVNRDMVNYMQLYRNRCLYMIRNNMESDVMFRSYIVTYNQIQGHTGMGAITGYRADVQDFVIERDKMYDVLDHFLKEFEKNELYEYCSLVSDIKDELQACEEKYSVS